MAERVPVSYEQLKNKAWRAPSNFAFAAGDTIATISADELHLMTPAYPTAFIETNGSFSYVALVGLAPGKNLFVNSSGQWVGRHVPLSYRGYPFSLSEVEGADDHVLCVDKASGLVVENESGATANGFEPFFVADNQPSEKVVQISEYLAKVKTGILAINVLTNQLREAELIVPWDIKLKVGLDSTNGANPEDSSSSTSQDSQLTTLQGLYKIDENKLHSLHADTLASLNGTNALKLAYCQLITMSHLPALGQLASSVMQVTQTESIFSDSGLSESLNFDNL